jgi:hypothetical protein
MQVEETGSVCSDIRENFIIIKKFLYFHRNCLILLLYPTAPAPPGQVGKGSGSGRQHQDDMVYVNTS